LRAAGSADTAAEDAQRIGEEASGCEAAAFVLALDDPVPPRMLQAFDAMLRRRLAGEPLQYVLGRWGFRSLDLFVDRRVLIPRPETEGVVEMALEALDRIAGGREAMVVDLGTGSGAIALSIAAERTNARVIATDASSAALDVARANLAGIGRAGVRVTLAAGSWYDALPDDHRGAVDVVVSNPPYVGTAEPLPASVVEWEPVDSLVSGPTGLEAIAAIVARAPEWLARPGALVVEIGETQGPDAAELARDAGFDAVDVRQDLAGRPRVLVASFRT
jgi:release factor glutamine methyltransferase